MALEVDIRKKCNTFELKVNFAHDKGILGVLGASGCGKSMTLKCIAGIETPNEGRIVLDGRVLFDSAKKINLPPQKRRVGYLFQNYALFPHMTVEQNILAGIKGTAAEKKEILHKYLKLFYLTDLKKAYPGSLSGGQQQRTALARIFASKPDILMLDEPFSALDDYLKWQVELRLHDTLKLYEGSILFVSHSRDEIYRFCDDVIVLSEGEIAADTSKKDLFDAPQTLAASELSGCKNHSAAAFTAKNEIRAADWNADLRVLEDSDLYSSKEKLYAGIRAHDIKLLFGRETGAENVFSCTVETVIENIFSYIVMLRLPGAARSLRLELSKSEWDREKRRGDSVSIQLPKEHIFLVK